MTAAAELLLEEIRSQPAAWRGLLDQTDALAEAGAKLAALRPSLVRIVAHGTSDHAGIYASYLLRIRLGWTVVRDSMSLPLYYDTPAAAPGELAIGISQSGETPDVVAWLAKAREAGATTLALTNGADSSLARQADLVLGVGVGRERSIAATKTYTGTLVLLALLAGYVAGDAEATHASLAEVADTAEATLGGLERTVAPVAEAFADAERMYLVGRGVELATVHEIGLKLTEIAYLGAKAMSATAMAHGPVAALDATVPVWAIAPRDATLPAVVEAARRAREAGAPVIAAGAAAGEIAGADHVLRTPLVRDPLLAPILSVLPGQVFSWALARAKGIDPGTPRHLRKITSAA